MQLMMPFKGVCKKSDCLSAPFQDLFWKMRISALKAKHLTCIFSLLHLNKLVLRWNGTSLM